ncbi:glycosyltransferase family 39 protein [Stieleria sp. ICT_E10.1]|uniref:glycosyltransferase family 39 protein n=1 Tax=Stieleria sedimenti TaxID=2976331 RepID=UPI0021801154|nr:glycosyltransferase family 39 protein [Stieleria sedimenti]MCS7471109.1 glycosyltransferase family 39 protein [Stieleria sedimenti]
METRTTAIDGRATLLAVVVVVSLSLAFRLPSCQESFWLDELHSAWVVADGFSEVAPRAAAGNQTTGYFHLLWIWSAVVGSGELPMRLSSVLASALASALLVVGVARRTGNVSAGLVAGGVLAIDPNGVFFGCELRAYAFVMLYAVLAVWSMMTWLGKAPAAVDGQGQSETHRFGPAHSYGGARWRLAMLFWICVAALVHPTSLGVLSLLIPCAVWVAWKRGRMRWWRADVFAVVVAVATLAALAMSSLPDSWQRRQLWRAFGQATSWWQLWYAWAWVPIVLLPLGAALGMWMASRLVQPFRSRSCDDPGEPSDRVDWIGVIPGLVAVTGTMLFFCASYFEWVPLWHRRYYVAALPLLAWTAGEMVAIFHSEMVRIVRGFSSVGAEGNSSLWLRRGCGIVVVVLFLGFVLWYQGTLRTLAAGRWPVQLRGEQWRGAVESVRGEIGDGDVVWLDSQLIEASFLRRPISEAGTVSEDQWDYLTFPLRGPYALDPVVAVGAFEHESWVRHHVRNLPHPQARVWLVSRSGDRSSRRFIDRLERFRPVSAVKTFPGRPVVFRLDFGE